MKLSLVTSAYKKESVIVEQLIRLENFFDRNKLNAEIILFIDGAIDNTEQIVKELIKEKEYNNIQIIVSKENMGKGYAIRRGLKVAKGDIVGYIDGDIDINLSTLKTALEAIKRPNIDVVAPSKYHKDSDVIVSPFRKILTRGYQWGSRIVLPVPKGVDDVSSGLKLFKADVIRNILPKLSVNRFAIDSEIFYWLKKFGYKVEMIPFFVEIQEGSTASNIKQILIMVKDIILLGIKTRFSVLLKYGFKGFINYYRYEVSRV